MTFQTLITNTCILITTLQLFFSPAPQQKSLFPENSLSQTSQDLSFLQGEDLCIPDPQGQKYSSYPGFFILFNPTHKQASWAAYHLTKEKVLTKNAERTDKFTFDPSVPGGSATAQDYYKSGYDRGHLVPAADMRYSPLAMEACFLYTNMSPQNPTFNRGIWSRLEEKVRDWAITNDQICIVTGPILTDKLSTIGPSKVSVPEYFYKAILDWTLPQTKAIGFIIPNTKITDPLSTFACTIDHIENLTGLDLFYLLPDEIENLLENSIDHSLWGF